MIEIRGATIAMNFLKSFIPLATLTTLASAMPFAPKIGPVVLVCAVATAGLPFLQMLTTDGVWTAVGSVRAALDDRRAAVGPLIVLALLGLLCGISLLWVPDPVFSVSRTLRLIGLLLLVTVYGLIFAHAGEADERRVQILCKLAVAGSALAILGLASSFVLVVPGKDNPDAFFNRTVVVLCLSSFAFCAYLRCTSWPGPVKLGLSLALFSAAAIFSLFSSSQTSSVALLCGVLAAPIFGVAPAVVRRVFVYAIAILCFAMPLLISALVSLPQSLFASDFLKRASALDRLRIWESYLTLVREKPWFGWGVEGSRNFEAGLLATRPAADTVHSFSTHPHNALLQIWTDLGLAGAILIGLLIAMLGLRIEKARTEARAPIYGLMVAIIATSAISHGAFQSWWLASIGLLAVSVFPLAAAKPTAREQEQE